MNDFEIDLLIIQELKRFGKNEFHYIHSMSYQRI